MSFDFVTHLILQYRYWVLIPLTFVEGPIVAFVAGTLASTGFFNIWGLAVLFFVRDVGLDGLYYVLGHYGESTGRAQRILAKIGVTQSHLNEARRLWRTRPGTTMFIGKLSYGISAAFIVAAGMMRMPLQKFFLYGSIVAILQYGTLLFLGYFLGASFGGSVDKILSNVQYIIAFAAVAMTAYFFIVIRLRNKVLADEKQHQIDQES